MKKDRNIRFKTGVISDEISQDFETAVKLAAKHGLSGIELRTVWDTAPEKLDQKQIKEIKAILKNYSLAIVSISSSIFKCDWKKEEPEKLENTVRLARELNSPFIRGFSFWKHEYYNDAEFAAVLKGICARLKEENLTLLLESDPAVNLTNGESLARLLAKVNSPQIAAIWDPGNDIYDPNHERPYPDGYNYIKKYVRHIHIKDAELRQGKIIGMPFGMGAVDYKGQFGALVDDGYDGYIMMETHYKKDKILDENLLKNPGGSAFSEGGIAATEECLVNLNNFLKQNFCRKDIV